MFMKVIVFGYKIDILRLIEDRNVKCNDLDISCEYSY